MQRLIKWSLFLALLSCNQPAGQPKKLDSEPAGSAAIEQALEAELKATRTPGAVLALVLDGRVIYEKGFGVANVETGQPVSSELLFRTGSVGKMLTSAVAVRMAAEGRLSLDEPIGRYVKLAPGLSRLTLRQLLSHSAGLISGIAVCCPQDESALKTEIQNWKDKDFFFTEPGKVFSYSNYGFMIAGLVLQEVAGKPYADLMHDYLFAPLGMERSFFRPTEVMTYPLSQGHEMDGDTIKIKRPFYNGTVDWPAGFAYTTAADLARFAIVLMNEGRLEEKQIWDTAVVPTMLRPVIALASNYGDLEGRTAAGTTEDQPAYGFGLMHQTFHGIPLLVHGGDIPGFGSLVAMAPGQKTAVIVMANKSGVILKNTAARALEVLLKIKPSPEASPASFVLSQQEMQGLAGTYVNGKMQFVIRYANGKLFFKESPAVEKELYKVGDNHFVYDHPDEGLTDLFILRDEEGRPAYVSRLLETARRVYDRK